MLSEIVLLRASFCDESKPGFVVEGHLEVMEYMIFFMATGHPRCISKSFRMLLVVYPYSSVREDSAWFLVEGQVWTYGSDGEHHSFMAILAIWHPHHILESDRFLSVVYVGASVSGDPAYILVEELVCGVPAFAAHFNIPLGKLSFGGTGGFLFVIGNLAYALQFAAWPSTLDVLLRHLETDGAYQFLHGNLASSLHIKKLSDRMLLAVYRHAPVRKDSAWWKDRFGVPLTSNSVPPQEASSWVCKYRSFYVIVISALMTIWAFQDYYQWFCCEIDNLTERSSLLQAPLYCRNS